jgi:hypothetical protein
MSTNPDPADTPGLEPGGGVHPGDTPPAADSMSQSQASPAERQRIPRAANTTALVVIGIVVVGVAALILAMVIVLITR